MDQWLDNVFDPILDGDLDELSDGRSLENRMRGGGEGVPGVTQVGTLSNIFVKNFLSCKVLNQKNGWENVINICDLICLVMYIRR